MAIDRWTRWPAGDVPIRERLSRPREAMGLVGRLALLVAVVWSTFASDQITGWRAAMAAGLIVAGVALLAGLFLASRGRRLVAALGYSAGLVVVGVLAGEGGALSLAFTLWACVGVVALVRLPLVTGIPVALVAFAAFAAVGGVGMTAAFAVGGGLALLGLLRRIDAEARSTQKRLLDQERAAHAAEAESAALAERARIAREIHDVLAHSLSAQLVHLEAARLMLDNGADREQVRERVVAARRMAQDGLAETRQALSALRGELTPVGEYLVELARSEQAALEIEGTARPIPAEAGLTLRRTAQEALTNVRKHAPGGRVAIRLAYREGKVELEVRNSRGPRGEDPNGLAEIGSGYGLLGMRERAELLGGELLAGPEDGGWRVLLRVPA